MKLAISGSAGTGKSTLAKAIAAELGWPCIPEFAREACEHLGVETPRDVPPTKRHEFQETILNMKMEEEAKHPNFVADRSTADNIAYYLWYNARNISDEEEAAGYLYKCEEVLATYDLIYFLDIGAFDLVDDGFRSVKYYYQLAIHNLIKGILVDCGVSYIPFRIKSHSDRTNIAVSLTQLLDKDRNAVGLFHGRPFTMGH